MKANTQQTGNPELHNPENPKILRIGVQTIITTVLAIMLALAQGAHAQQFDSGTGTETDPYIIMNKSQLEALATAVNTGNNYSGKYIKLGADIVLNDTTANGGWQNWDNTTTGLSEWTPIGTSSNSFQGDFDGNGKIISGLYIKTTLPFQGLFGSTEYANISNLGLEGFYVSGNNSVGGIAGNNYGSVSNSYAIGNVSGNRSVGGIAGNNSGGSVSNSYFDGNVSGNNSVGIVASNRIGGIAGNNTGGSVSNSYAIGNVSGDSYIGGIAGYNSDGSVSNSYFDGSVSGDLYVGGIAGDNSGSVSNSYAIGNMSGGSYVGGIAGDNSGGSVSNSYAIGNVSGDSYVGGIAGYNTDYGYSANSYSTVSNSYFAGSVSGDSHIGGIVGDNDGSVSNSYYNSDSATASNLNTYGTPKTTAEMQSSDFHALLQAQAIQNGYTRWTYNANAYPTFSDIIDDYTITFNANGGTVSPASATAGTTSSYRLASLPTPTRNSYVFNGWFTADTGGTKVDTSTVFNANTTVYAQWADATPILRPQIASTQISARAVGKSIALQNLPSNAKVEVYSLQGKRIYSVYSANTLQIGGQANGMYIVKVSFGSQIETLRVAVR